MVDERISAPGEVDKACRTEADGIRQRARELAARHADRAALFEDYVRAQEVESRVLATEARCALGLLRLS